MARTGNLSETPFTDLVQYYASSRQTVALVVNLPDGQGEDGIIYIEDGEVVDAWLGDAVGRDAVRRATRLADGTFRVEPDICTAERTISEPLAQLLAEGTMHLDEEPREGRAAAPPAPSAGSTTPGVRVPDGGAFPGGAVRPTDAERQVVPVASTRGAQASSREEVGAPGRGRAARSTGRARRRAVLFIAVTAAVLIVAGIAYSRCGPPSSVLRAPGVKVTMSDTVLRGYPRVVRVTSSWPDGDTAPHTPHTGSPVHVTRQELASFAIRE
jgi:hypothetical protein